MALCACFVGTWTPFLSKDISFGLCGASSLLIDERKTYLTSVNYQETFLSGLPIAGIFRYETCFFQLIQVCIYLAEAHPYFLHHLGPACFVSAHLQDFYDDIMMFPSSSATNGAAYFAAFVRLT